MANATKKKTAKKQAAATKSASPDRVHAALTKLCLALPEAEHKVVNTHAQYTVRKKTFAYFLNDHHGDGIVAVTMKVPPGENARLAADDARYYLPAYLAKSGWVALRLDQGAVDWGEVRALVAGSYRAVAPKKLAALVAEA